MRVCKATTLPLVVGFLLMAPACRGDESAPGPLKLRVVGEEYEWQIRYPGPDGALDTPDDVLVRRDIHVPEDAPVEIELRSRDYLYGFRIPGLGVNEVAVPDLPMFARIETPPPGTYALLGDQLCGYAHKSLIGEMVVQPRSEFDRWVERQKERTP